jgi:glucose-1-phosphate cytidylyltransferase
MKVVIFAGGLGTRMRDDSDLRPKPMLEIGGRPILWHLMKIYSSYGYRDFVILAGYKAGYIKDYFSRLDINTRDFEITTSTGDVRFLSGDSEDWKVAVLDTGQDTLTGERLLNAKHILGDDPFFCTYGDGLAPVQLAGLLSNHRQSGAVATMTVTRPESRFGEVSFDDSGTVTDFKEKPLMANWVNMGFFAFNKEIFDYLRPSESLEQGALVRMSQLGKLNVFRHEGFWQPMDTYREFRILNELWDGNQAPWVK